MTSKFSASKAKATAAQPTLMDTSDSKSVEKMSNLQSVHLRGFPSDLYQAAKVYGIKTGRKVPDVIAEALSRYLREEGGVDFQWEAKDDPAS